MSDIPAHLLHVLLSSKQSASSNMQLLSTVELDDVCQKYSKQNIHLFQTDQSFHKKEKKEKKRLNHTLFGIFPSSECTLLLSTCNWLRSCRKSFQASDSEALQHVLSQIVGLSTNDIDEEKQQQVEEEDNKILLSTIPIRSRLLLKKYKMSALLMDALSPSELDLSLPIHSVHSIAVNEIHLMRDLFMDHLLRTMLHSSLTNGHLSTKYDIGAVLLQKDKKENNDNDNNTEKKNETDCISVQDIEACMSLVASAECMSRRNGLGLSTYTEVMLKATKVIHYIRCSLKFQNSNDLTKSLENEACR